MAPQSPLALHFATLKEFYIGKVTLGGEGGEIGCCAFLMELCIEISFDPPDEFEKAIFLPALG